MIATTVKTGYCRPPTAPQQRQGIRSFTTCSPRGRRYEPRRYSPSHVPGIAGECSHLRQSRSPRRDIQRTRSARRAKATNLRFATTRHRTSPHPGGTIIAEIIRSGAPLRNRHYLSQRRGLVMITQGPTDWSAATTLPKILPDVRA